MNTVFESPAVVFVPMGMRGATSSSVLNIGAGGPVGVSAPWARAENWEANRALTNRSKGNRRLIFIYFVQVWRTVTILDS